jgi:WD40 repeat protein
MNRYLLVLYFVFCVSLSIAGDFTTLGQGQKITRLAASGNGMKLAAIHEGILDIWDLESQSLIKSTSICSSKLICLDASADLETIAMGSNDGRIFIFTKNVGVKSINIKNSTIVSALTLDGDLNYVYAGTSDGVIFKIDIIKERLVEEVAIHDKMVTGLALNKTTNQVISCGADGKIIISNANQLSQNYHAYKNRGWIRSISLNDEQEILYAGNDNGKIIQLKQQSTGKYTFISEKREFWNWITALKAIQDNNVSSASLSGKIVISFKFGQYHKNLNQKIYDIQFIPIDTNFFNLAIATEKDGIVLLSSKDMKLKSRK